MVMRMRMHLRNRQHALPDLLILGAQKCGTTSLFAYLSTLPGFIPPSTKELHHFDTRNGDDSWQLGLGWYRSQFPLRSELDAANAITGEASPSYMLEPLAMTRIARHLPDSKWIVVLRDPVERAFSQYSRMVQRLLVRNVKVDPFAQYISAELTESEAAQQSRLGPQGTAGGKGQLFVQRGHFADQLTHLRSLRPEQPTLVLFSENLFAGDTSSFEILHDFIGLPDPRPESFPHENLTGVKSEMDPSVRAALIAHYSKVNAGLAELLGSDHFVTIDPQRWPEWVGAGVIRRQTPMDTR